MSIGLSTVKPTSHIFLTWLENPDVATSQAGIKGVGSSQNL